MDLGKDNLGINHLEIEIYSSDLQYTKNAVLYYKINIIDKYDLDDHYLR